MGKTTSVRHFAGENYKYVIYVDVRSETDLSILESASESNVVERLTAFCEAHPEIFKSYVNGKQLDMQFEVLLDSFKNEIRTRTAEICDFDKFDTMFYTICEVLCREKKGNARIVEVTSKLTEQAASKRISTKECNNILSWLQSANIINFCDKKDLATGELYSSERFYFEDLGLFCYLCRKYQIDAFAVKNQYELDFIVTSKIDRQTYGIEVKAGNNTAISLKKMLQTKDIDFAILAKGDAKVGEKEKIYTLPIFLVSKFTFDKGKAVKEDEPKRMDFFK